MASNKCVLSQGALTFDNENTAFGSIKFTEAHTVQFSDSLGGTATKVKLTNIATPASDARL